MAMIIVGGGQFKGSSGGDGDGGGQDSNDEDLHDDDEQVEWNTASRRSGEKIMTVSLFTAHWVETVELPCRGRKKEDNANARPKMRTALVARRHSNQEPMVLFPRCWWGGVGYREA